MPMNRAVLRRARLTLGYTQAQLATALGVDKMSVSRWERGAHPIPTLVGLALQQLTPRAGGEHLGQATEKTAMPPVRARAIRSDLGLTRRALARKMGVEPAVVARWETGVVPIPAPAANRLRRLYREYAKSRG